MESTQTGNTPASAPPRRWPLFLMGGLLFLIGPIIYAVQVTQKQLGTAPWYVPILATIGVLLMGTSVWQRRGILRSIGLALFVLVGGLEWFFLAEYAKTPLYDGPVRVGGKLPTFDTNLASGAAYSNGDLEKGKPTLLVFFRGRW